MKKLNGLLVYNKYLTTNKYLEVHHIYKIASEKYEINLTMSDTEPLYFGIYNNKCINFLELEKFNFILFLDKDILLAKSLEKLGFKVFNSSRVIEICDDKAKTFLELANKNITMPHTIISPLIFEGTYTENDDWLQNFPMEFPIVVKESFGSFGEQVYLAKNLEELTLLRQKLVYKPHIYQQFISTSYGKDVRIHVVGEEVVASMLRISSSDFRANASQGANIFKYEPPQSFIELAKKVAISLKSDFIGVDILFGEDDEPILCEVNSNAHIKNIFDVTNINVAEKIMEHILQECTK